MKPVRLSVHKNNSRQRKLKEKRHQLVSDAKELTREIQDLDGYVIVAWDNEATARALWSSERIPGTLVGEMAKRVVERTIEKMDMRDVLEEW